MLARQPDMEGAMLQCQCGQMIADAAPGDTVACPHCGRMLSMSVATQELDGLGTEQLDARLGTSTFDEGTSIILAVRDGEGAFVIPAQGFSEVVLGRHDPETGEAPTIDLSAFDAVNKGVSRRHVLLSRRDLGQIQVTDLGSPNGSFLNGMRLVAQQPRILRDNDELRLGRLVLTVRFERAK